MITFVPFLSAFSILTLVVLLITKSNGSKSHNPSPPFLLFKLISISLTSKFAPDVSILPPLFPLLINVPLTFVNPFLLFISLHITIIPPFPLLLEALITTLSSIIVLLD